MRPSWNFRPTALYRDYATAGVWNLLQCYKEDNQTAAAQMAVVPPRPTAAEAACRQLRTCQWNINSFEHGRGRGGRGTRSYCERAEAIADVLVQADADVIILNEFGHSCGKRFAVDTNGSSSKKSPQQALARRLHQEGYSFHCAESSFPTVSLNTTAPRCTTVMFLGEGTLQCR